MKPKQWYEIDTGISLDGNEKCVLSIDGKEHVIDNWFMQIAPRSSLGMRFQFRFSNTVGIIDQDYRGHIIFDCMVDEELILKKGDKIAQGILIPYLRFIDEIKPQNKRVGGIGSTGR